MMISERRARMERYLGESSCPKDFAAHWEQIWQELVVREIQRERVAVGNPCAEYECLHIHTGQGETVHARYLRPAAGSEPYPVLLMYHDMGRGVRGWHHMTRFVGLGYAVVALENRMGAEESMETICPDRLEQCYIDALAAAKAAMLLPEADTARLTAWGEGFGGGLALAVSAVVPQSVRCACLNPMPTELKPEMAYLDAENFSGQLHGSLLLGTGLMDDVASPWGQYACFHRAPCRKRHLVYPKYGHERINAFENEHIKFLNLWSEPSYPLY